MAAELFSVIRTGTVNIAKHELGLAGDWDNTNWRDIVRLAEALIGAESDALKLSRDSFKLIKILQIDGALCIPLVACHVVNGSDLDDSAKVFADEVLAEFVTLVTGKHQLDNFQSSESTTSQSRDEIANAHAKQFLRANGNRRLTSDVFVRGPQTQITICGRYAPKPKDCLPQSSTLVVEGVVDSLEISGRALTILQGAGKSKLLIRFDEREHFQPLHAILGNPAEFQFNVREIWAGHKITVELLDVLGPSPD